MAGTDYLPPAEMTLEAAGTALAAALDVRAREPAETDRSYFDTFDGLLHEEGLSVVHEDGRLTLVSRDSGEERATLPMPLPTEPLLVLTMEDSALRQALLEVVDVRALLPLAHVHCRVHALDALDERQKTVVRIAIEQPMLVAPGDPETALRPRVRLAAVRGYDKELARVRERLSGELGFAPADQPLVDEAVRATGRAPGGISSKPNVPLSADQRADAAAATVLGALLDVIRANLDGTIADIDSEFLHDFRVSVRRTRAVQRELKGVFPPPELIRFRTDFRWLQQVTGDSRDLDVYVLEFDAMRALVPESIRADLDPLLDVLRDHRQIAHASMVSALRTRRTHALLRDWGAFLEELVQLPLDARPDAPRTIGDLAGTRIAKVYRQMVKMGRAIDHSSPPEDYHELRKKGKELRYLLELFGAQLFDGDVVKPMVKSLKALQDVLGRHQDREVQVGRLRALRDEVAERPGGPAALMAMGVLVERLCEDERAAREEFASRFAVFASKSERKLVKATFR